MPVAILDDAGTTSLNDGTIRHADLEKMVTDFRQNVMIAGTANSGYIVPKHSFYFSKLQLRDLLDSNPDANAIEISLGIQLPGSIESCNNGATATDTSNSVVAVISSCKKPGGVVFRNVGNLVMISGYNTNTAGGGGAPDASGCCPSTNP